MIHRWVAPHSSDMRSDTIWLTVYADLITNLMLVFMVMFGLAMIGEPALQTAGVSMRRLSVMGRGRIPPSPAGETASVDRVRSWADKASIPVSQGPGEMRLTFGDSVLFDPGSARLKPGAGPLLAQLAGQLRALPWIVVVEGHTDDQPLPVASHFQDNWDLSLARSMAVVDALSNHGGMNPERIAAAGYGPYHPVYSNATREGRRRNRRVEVVLMKNFPVAGDVHGH